MCVEGGYPFSGLATTARGVLFSIGVDDTKEIRVPFGRPPRTDAGRAFVNQASRYNCESRPFGLQSLTQLRTGGENELEPGQRTRCCCWCPVPLADDLAGSLSEAVVGRA